ncbi:hypothetical protein [Rhizobium sp. CSW-27]|uniref:hypothetical protein n=1 Tax=Rhizobium sp. CSW-27 TaxID=2839985 RepID=UPI001C02CCC6|nr:hypothetical protein [Rhizobium sp. CSW-27]MBT9370253.1 hypothetical protein [Rhizobium sp. CSW-27]
MERVIERSNRRGTPLADDPHFLTLIDGWVSGTLSLSDVRDGFLAQLQARQAAVRLRYRARLTTGTGARGNAETSKEKGRSTLSGSALSDPDSFERAAGPQQEAIDTGDGR